MLLALVALHMLVGGVVPLLARRIGTRAFFVAALVPAMSFAWLLTQAGTVTSGGVLGSQVAWIPTIGVSLTLRMGLVQWILALIVTGVGALVLLYCRWYFSPGPAATRCLTLLTWFAGTMLGLVSADDLIVLYVMWELTTVYSYLLIGNDFTRKANRGAALTALIVTTIGGLAMLVGIVILWVLTSTLSLSAIVAAPPTGALATVAA
ncbi:MAG: Na(+)/H(+) antiporter subunit, partial [Actinomyces urogenitalis DORA_12]